MINLLLSLLGLSLLDCLNPATIATLIILLPMVKKVSHSAIFIWGTFITYFVIGISFYYGINNFIKSFVIEILAKYSFEISVFGIFLAVALLGIGIKFSIKIYKTIKYKQSIKEVKFINIDSVNPIALIGLSIISTLSDAPTAIPYIAFISNLLSTKVKPLGIILMLLIYCLVYILPMLILYLSYQKLKDRFETIVTKTKNLTNVFSVYAIPTMALIVGIWLLNNSVVTLLG